MNAAYPPTSPPMAYGNVPLRPGRRGRRAVWLISGGLVVALAVTLVVIFTRGHAGNGSSPKAAAQALLTAVQAKDWGTADAVTAGGANDVMRKVAAADLPAARLDAVAASRIVDSQGIHVKGVVASVPVVRSVQGRTVEMTMITAEVGGKWRVLDLGTSLGTKDCNPSVDSGAAAVAVLFDDMALDNYSCALAFSTGAVHNQIEQERRKLVPMYLIVGKKLTQVTVTSSSGSGAQQTIVAHVAFDDGSEYDGVTFSAVQQGNQWKVSALPRQLESH